MIRRLHPTRWKVEWSIKLGMFDRLKMMYVVQSSNRVMRTPILFSAFILFSAHHSYPILDFYFSISCIKNMSLTKSLFYIGINNTVLYNIDYYMKMIHIFINRIFSRFEKSRSFRVLNPESMLEFSKK